MVQMDWSDAGCEADNPMSMHDDYQQMLVSAIPTLTQIDGNQLRLGLPFHHERTAGIHPIVRQGINPQAEQLLSEVLANSKAGQPTETLITTLKNPDAPAEPEQ